MGCDIHTVTEIKTADGWKGAHLEPDAFGGRYYPIFGFLANICNVSRSPYIADPRGWPDDISDEAKELLETWVDDGWGLHWVTLAELKSYNYDQIFENRRIVRTVGNVTDCAAIAEPGEGKQVTLREFLEYGGYFYDLERLSELGSDVRILMLFDN